jgi:adenylate kinase family enzyme
MNEWSKQLFEEKLGNKVEYGVIVGKSLSGKTTIANKLSSMLGSTILDMKKITDKVRTQLGTDDEPFEGEVPIAKVEEYIAKTIQAAGPGSKFLFDSYTHPTDEGFLAFISKFGSPSFVIILTADEQFIKERWMKRNEVEDFPEDQLETLKADSNTNKARRQFLLNTFEATPGRVSIISLNTSTSIESTMKELQNKVSPKVVLVNHEKKLPVDTTCTNLAIKYNMIYISAYQVIKNHIEQGT